MRNPIRSFILTLVPQLTLEPKEKKTKNPTKSHMEKNPLKQLRSCKSKGFKVVPLGKTKPTHVIDHNSTYQVQLELEKPLETKANSFLVFAKPMAGGKKRELGRTAILPEAKPGKITIPIHPNLLAPGTYRLTAAMNIHTLEADAPTSTNLSESSLVQVY